MIKLTLFFRMDPVLILMMSLPLIFSIFYFFMSWHFDYWRKKGIPSAEGTVPFGNIGDIVFMKKTMAQVYEDIYRYLSYELCLFFEERISHIFGVKWNAL
jgi:cytochrome P450 family 28